MSFFKTKNGNSIFHKGPALQAAGLAVLLFFLSGCEKELETAQIALGGKSFTRGTSVSEVTGADGTYKEITVTTTWQEMGNSQSVQIMTIISQ